MTPQERMIAPFLNEEGLIRQWPSKHEKKVAVLAHLAQQFECERDYTEKEVNAICEAAHTFSDFHLLRRELIEEHFLARTRDGARYWRLPEQSEIG